MSLKKLEVLRNSEISSGHKKEAMSQTFLHKCSVLLKFLPFAFEIAFQIGIRSTVRMRSPHESR